ncbi:MAG: glutaredoxin domain-containing protein [Desulfobacterales bacterium]|nr:glutaredoxin domain-containing protein [Desulfobacterales bacterium]
MKTQLIWFVISLLMLTFGLSSAEIFKWIDENGVTHYSDSPTRDISDAVEIENKTPPSASPASADQSPSPHQATPDTLDKGFFDFLKDSQEQEVAAKAPTVEIYETDWCGYCKKAKNFFRSRGIKFSTYDIDKNPRAARRMMTMTNRRAVPFVVINGKGIQGYSEQAYLQALQH